MLPICVHSAPVPSSGRYNIAPPDVDATERVLRAGDGADRQRAEISTPEARHLAGLWAIAVDLDFVIAFCERLIALGADRDERNIPRDALGAQAFWVAALIAYARCFDRGRRGVALSDDDVASEDAAWHRTFVALRDRHIAHPIDPRAEGYAVDVALTLPKSGPRAVTGVVVYGHKDASGSSQQVRELLRIATAVRKLVGDRVATGQTAVTVQARALPIEELYETPASKIVLRDAPGPDPLAPERRKRVKAKDQRRPSM